MPDRLRDAAPSAENGWTERLQAFPLRGLTISAAVAALVLVANVPLARRNTQLLADHGAALIYSYQVIARLNEVFSLEKDAETSTRGFVITGDSTYLEPFNASQRDLPGELRRLDELTKADATQQARIAVFRASLARHQEWLRETARVRAVNGLAAAEARIRSGAGKVQMDAMRIQVADMRAHEEGLLQGRTGEAAIAYRQVLRSGLLAALGALLSFAALLLLAYRHFKARNAALNEILETKKLLEESEHRLHAALRVAGMMAWELDIRSGRLSLSDNAVALLGLTDGQRLDDLATGLTLCHPADLAALQQALSTSLETGEKLDITCRIIRPVDGAVRWVHIRADMVRDDHQTPVRVLGMLLDITERRTAQDDVARLSALLHAINEATPDFVVTKDVEGRVTYANAATCRGLGKSLEELIGKTNLEFHEDQEQARAIIANDQLVIRTGEAQLFDEVADLADGRRWFYSAKMPQRNADGEIVGLIVVARDITDRKRAEEALLESESRFRTLADNAPVMIWLSDGTGAITYTNAQWQSFIDADPAATTADIARSLHSDDADTFRQMIADLPRQRGSVTLELRVCRADGRYRWVICTATPRWSEAGAFLGGIGSLLDIEERKVLENDLRMLAADLSAADRRKDEFLATLAHELRNPLAPIRNGLEILRLALPANETIDRTRGMMERQLVQIVRLVDDLLDISRISSGKLSLQRARIDLRDAIALAIEATNATRASRSQKLVYQPPPDPVTVDGDLFRLGQVFTNLLDNAQKYSPPHGQIWLSLHSDGTSVEVRVRDRGQGIPSDMLTEVFELFTQVDRSLERSQGGLGIGLTLVKRLIEMHGGTVLAHSDGDDQGSEFSVRLPLVSGAIRTLGDPARQNAGDGDAHTILVADDNVDGAATLAMMLAARGHHVETANDGLSAVALGETMRPSLVLLDIGMPGLNGYEVCQRLRAMSWGEQATIVALTGWGQEHDRKRSADAGFDYHVVKPLDPSTLERILQRVRSGVRRRPIA